jgi:hypothetical protein
MISRCLIVPETSRVLCLVLCLGSVSACKTPENREKDDAELAADFVDNRPRSGQTWTEARIFSFDQYATDLLNFSGQERNRYNELALQLDESFKVAGLTRWDPLSTYKIRMGAFGECFGEDRGDYNLWWNSQRDAVRRQIEEVAWFVRDAHYAMHGKNAGAFSFREVVLCPENKLGSKMLLEGWKLHIGIPTSGGSYRPIPNKGPSEPTLKGLWDSGAPVGIGAAPTGIVAKTRALFSSEQKASSAVRSMWGIFNPLSQVRQGLRKLLHEHRATVQAALGRLGAPRQPLTAELSTTQVMEILRELSGTTQAASLTGTTLDLEQLSRVRDNWRCLIESPDALSGIENDAMAMIQDNVVRRTNVRNDVEAGLVAVVNHHDVSVLLAIGSGEFSKYLESAVVQEFQVESRVRAGLVAVSTSDNISVDVRFLRSTGAAFRRATFEKAVRAAQRAESLCST